MKRGAAMVAPQHFKTMAKKTKMDAFYPDRVEKGQFVTRAVVQLMRQYEGQQVEVCIRAKRFYTTQPQRGYYWGVVIFLIGERMRDDGVTGRYGGPITDQEVHEMMGLMFLRFSVCVNHETGECVDMQWSTTELTVTQMSEYIERVIAWAVKQYSRDVVDDEGNTIDVQAFEIPEANKQLTFV